MRKIDFDNYINTYNQMLRQQTGFFTPNEAYFAQYKVTIVRDKIPKEPHRILEFGCGIGGNIPYLRKAFRSAEIMGSDVSALSLEVARNENPGIYFWQEGDVAAMPQEGFDLILVTGVFHHIPPLERIAVAKLLFTRLLPGGWVFVFEHNPYNPVTRHIVNNCPYDEGVVLLRPSELQELLRQGGLEVEEQKFSLFFPQRLKLVLPLERYLGWLPLGGQYWVLARRPPTSSSVSS
ncbi:MAG: class I SAM-dependent methyltransferase [Candidatus Competibacteraceae bacterium]|nr:class I SAM-dependent methyltransferase [Candidatus Competibacteraceae bacterium]MBK9952357.1 class I SAM-dependent methyltransferase [Candidatus Competibacteraceae bacterium]